MQVVTVQESSILLDDLVKEFTENETPPLLTVLAVNYGGIYRLLQLPEGSFFFTLVVDTGLVPGHTGRNLGNPFSVHIFEATLRHIISDLGAKLHVFLTEREAAAFIDSLIGESL